MNDELKRQSIINSLIKFLILNPIAMGSSFIIFLSSCSVQKQIAKSANKDVLDAVPLQTAHVGISIYEPSTDKYWYDYQGDKYFVPASNTKIPTCYAAMKYLGDSLVGLKYKMEKGEFVIQGTADPTFLHKDFKDQPVFDFIKKISAISLVGFSVSNWQEEHWGSGWSWNDYNESYMTERSPFPIYANLVAFSLKDNYIKATPSAFDTVSITYLPGTNPDSSEITREISSNYFAVGKRDARFKAIEIPFTTKGYEVSTFLLNDTVKAQHPIYELPKYLDLPIQLKHIYSQPTDSVLKPMMHRSDNFFAEQLLLMVSNERLGIMNDERIIDTLLKTDFKDLPQKPGWVDGSGLSRYNLFTPKDFIFILNKMKNEFGMERVKIIFPTGGEGTLADYYVTDSNYIYAKTGTLSGVIAISGYLYTKKGKELIFSVLVNNHKASGTEVRRAVEKFLHGIRNKY